MSTARRRLKSPQSLSNPSTHPTIWPWNYKVKVLGVVKGKNHIVSPVSNWFAFFLFPINQITIPEIQLFWKLTLKNQRSMLWESSKVKVTWFYSERPRGAGFRSVNPAERWRENPARALARAGFSQHLECGIHRSESSPEGSFALIPHPVARWAKTTP